MAALGKRSLAHAVSVCHAEHGPLRLKIDHSRSQTRTRSESASCQYPVTRRRVFYEWKALHECVRPPSPTLAPHSGRIAFVSHCERQGQCSVVPSPPPPDLVVRPAAVPAAARRPQSVGPSVGPLSGARRAFAPGPPSEHPTCAPVSVHGIGPAPPAHVQGTPNKNGIKPSRAGRSDRGRPSRSTPPIAELYDMKARDSRLSNTRSRILYATYECSQQQQLRYTKTAFSKFSDGCEGHLKPARSRL